MPKLERENVQAIILEPYKYPTSRHLIFRFEDTNGARRFIAAWETKVTMGDRDLTEFPEPLINLSLTWNGIKKLKPFEGVGGNEAAERAFPWHFKDPPDRESLRVAGPSAPEKWWHQQISGNDIDLIVHLYCRTDETLQAATSAIRMSAASLEVQELIPTSDGEAITGRAFAGRQLHFGYQDGISHPPVNWDQDPDCPDLLPRGMFLIDEWIEDAQSFPRHPPFRDFAHHGSYMAFVWIYQDVAAFRRYLKEAGPQLRPDISPSDAEEWLAAKLMGRWRSGAPLALAPENDDPALSMANDFNYSSDRHGTRCPFAAHIRIVNGRDQPLNFRNASMFPSGFPQVLRRGTPYGADLVGDQDDGSDRGVVGMFVCANLNQQFFPLTRWIGKTDFSDVYSNKRGQDPLLGHREFPDASSDFEIPGKPSVVLRGLPSFVRLQGVALTFLPSRITLKTLAALA
jgi:deferrochelatase/peroxidase EfeB